MKELFLGSCIFHVSEEMLVELYKGDSEDIQDTQRNILYFLVEDIQKLASQALVPEEMRDRIKILHAHESLSNPWSYEDAGQSFPVQEWVDKMDGTASVLIIACCNTDNADITAKKSSVAYVASDFNLHKAMYGEVKLKTSIPCPSNY